MLRLTVALVLLGPACSRNPVATPDGGPPIQDGRPIPRGQPDDQGRPVHDGREGGPDLRSEAPDLRPVLPPVLPSDHCLPGDRRWCDGLEYSGWGQVECDPPTGRWKTKVSSGTTILDCRELASGERPNTPCACYHSFFNPNCCEQPGCVLPAGSQGQICQASPGNLCDYCDPLKPSCTEPDARCIVTNSHETFCGRFCSPSKLCPSGFSCMVVKLKTGNTNQCVPNDFSCYF